MVKINLEQRSKSLHDALKIAQRRTRVNSKVRKERGIELSMDYMMVSTVCICDCTIDMLVSNRKPVPDVEKNMLLRYVEDLKKLSEENKDFGVALNGYLPRLKSFADKDKSLKPIYEAYQNAFGGYRK